MAKIKVHLSTKALSAASERLGQQAKELQEKKDRLIAQLAEEGAEVAREIIGTSSAGNELATVTVEDTDNGKRIRASGRLITFLEFGTGVFAGKGYGEIPPDLPFEVAPGSWSQTVGKKQFVPGEHEYWVHNGVTYIGQYPRKPMLEAVQHIRQRIEPLAREIFEGKEEKTE